MDNIVGYLDDFIEQSVKDIVSFHPWMKEVSFLLLTKKEEIEAFVNKAIEKKICAIDLETTSLNTRVDENSKCIAKIVGVCLSCSPDEGVYIPVAHEDASEYNVPVEEVISYLKKIYEKCVLVFHNIKYDGEVLRYYDIVITDPSKYEDTYLLAAVEDSSRKEKGLKYLSKEILKRPQLEFEDVVESSSNFSYVPPQKALYYAAADAMNTLALYYYLMDSLRKQEGKEKGGLFTIYEIEKKCVLVTMEMERNLVRIDVDYIKQSIIDINNRMSKIIDDIYKICGHKFDINSVQQLGKVLFEELKIPYPEGTLKTKTGHYQTNSEILEKIRDKNIIVDLILKYRGYVKIKSTYLENWLQNVDVNGMVKFQLNQVQADTGRFSSTGGKGLNIDGYCKVNCQNIPVYDKNDPDAVNLRRAIIANPGYKIVSIDYSGQELRIATNFSKEPKWIKEFKEGSGDLHTITAQIITGKEKVTKEERKLAKTLNFLTLYGGGPGSFSLQAKIPIEKAKQIMTTFFKEYKGLSNWIKSECERARKRGYSLTALGRRRSLREFYDSDDPKVKAKGDRCAINSAIQGTGADIMKIALRKVYNWIQENKLHNDVRILLTIHDEIVYEIKEDKLEMIIPELCEIMKLKDLIKALKWEVPLEVDAEYGDSFDVDHNFWEEHKDKVNTEEKKEEHQEEQKVKNYDFNNNSSISINVNSGTYYHNILMEYSISQSNGIIQSTDGKSNTYIDDKGIYNYIVDTGIVVNAYKIKFIFQLLKILDTIYVGRKSKIRILAKTGEIVHTTSEEYSIDAFITLCMLFNI